MHDLPQQLAILAARDRAKKGKKTQERKRMVGKTGANLQFSENSRCGCFPDLLGVFKENSREIAGKMREDFSRIARCFKF